MLRIFVACFLVASLNACKKGEERKSSFSFEFNGKKYEDVNGCGIMISEKLISLDRPDLFGGKIIYYAPNCAFLVPAAFLTPTSPGLFTFERNACKLSGPIDSVQFYFYRSGTINFSTKNCRHKRQMDYDFPGYMEWDLCDVEGTFSLTLGNKNDQTIVITNGSFKLYDEKW